MAQFEPATARPPSRRADQDWIADLSASGERRDQALRDLGEYLRRGLRGALGRRMESAALPVEDFTQDALVRILAQLHTFRGESLFLTWCMSVAVRVALSELRRARWKDVSLEEMVASGRLAAPLGGEESAEDALAADQLRRIVARVVEEELTERQRMALEAKVAGVHVEEIARRMGSNRNAMYKLLHDARLKIKRALEREGWKGLA